MGKINRPKLITLSCVKKMPLFSHITKETNYDIMKSEVCNWIVNQPEVREWIYKKWQGFDYNED